MTHIGPVFAFLFVSWVNHAVVVEAQIGNSTQELQQRAQNAIEHYRFEEAQSLLTQLIEQDPPHPEWYVQLGATWIGLQNPEKAREAFERAIQLDPDHAEAHTLLAIYYYEEVQNSAEAEKHLLRALETHPHYKKALQLWIEILVSQRRLEEAVQQVQTWKEIQLDEGTYYFFQGQIAFLQNQLEPAETHFQKALKAGATYPEIHRFLAQIYQALGKTDLAQSHLKQFQERKKIEQTKTFLLQQIRLKPEDAARWFALGIYYLQNNDSDRALSHLTRGLELDSNQAKIQSLVGKIYLQRNQADDALPYVQKAVEINPDSGEDWNNLGICYLFQKDYSRAIAAFENALQRGGDNPRIRSNLEAARAQIKKTTPERH